MKIGHGVRENRRSLSGAGKTKTAIEAICEFWRVYAKNNGFMVWITERSELCEQAYETMKDTWRAKGDFPINLYKIYILYKFQFFLSHLVAISYMLFLVF